MRFIRREIKVTRCVITENLDNPIHIFHFEIIKYLFGFIKLPPLFGTCEVKTYPEIKAEFVRFPVVSGTIVIDKEIEDTVLSSYYRYTCKWKPVEVVRCEIETDED